MLIGVLSDTHDNVVLAKRAVHLLLDLGATLIFHLGDIVSPFTLLAMASEASGRAAIRAVFGNNCGDKTQLRRVAESLGVEIEEPPREVVVNGRRILLLHGWGSPSDTRRIVYALARGGEWDAILYGHTHEVDYRYIQGVLVLNPGEASGVLHGKPTVALLDTETLKARILEVQLHG
ncbi:MAG: metallophosphoesterase [Desulfurococcales archaeon]|nr:metallophosphoesterase [Desulfurococcales archaeon]